MAAPPLVRCLSQPPGQAAAGSNRFVVRSPCLSSDEPGIRSPQDQGITTRRSSESARAEAGSGGRGTWPGLSSRPGTIRLATKTSSGFEDIAESIIACLSRAKRHTRFEADVRSCRVQVLMGVHAWLSPLSGWHSLQLVPAALKLLQSMTRSANSPAKSCLVRGYAVEHEAAARSALRSYLQ